MKRLLLLALSFVISPLVLGVNLLPQANLKLSTPRLEFGQTLTLDATDSRNSQGLPYRLQYRFKGDRNQKWSPFSSRPTFSYNPTDTGNKTAYLEVKDLEKGYKNLTIQPYRVIVPQKRNARIIVLNGTNVAVGEEVFFRLVYSIPRNTDRQQIKTRWDFDSDGIYDTPFKNIQTVSYVYNQTGSFRPKAEVQFPTGETLIIKGLAPVKKVLTSMRTTTNDSEKIKVRLAKINAPKVTIRPSYKVYNEQTPIRFDASGSKTTENSWIEFQFDGQPFIVGKQVTKHFKSPGKHTVLIRHCFNHKNPVCAITTKTVQIQKKPTDFRVDFTVYDPHNSASNLHRSHFYRFIAGKPLRFQANVQNYSFPVNSFEYRWDFNGDGKFDTPFSRTNFAEYTYPRSGKFKVVVQVKNEFSREDKSLVWQEKIVSIVNNETPTGFFEIKKVYKNIDKTKNSDWIYVGDRVQIIPKIKDKDHYPSALQVRFDIDGDDIWDTDFRYMRAFPWQFNEAGEYIAKMQIKDPNGVIVSTKQKILVHFNPPPQIKVIVSKKSGKVGDFFTLDASSSKGHNLVYTWDIPDEKIIKNSQQSKLSLAFKTPGEKVISLRIMDNWGHSKWVQFPVFVRAKD